MTNISINYEDGVEFLPITSEKQLRPYIPKHKRNTEFMDHELKKGKYDIDFLINVLQIIHDKNKNMLLSPQAFQFTLDRSVTALLAYLRTEKLPSSGIYHDPLSDNN